MQPEAFGNTEKFNGAMEFKTKEGDTVTLRWNICHPTKPKILNAKKSEYVEPGKPDEAVLFLPGVAVEADSLSIVQSAQAFANASQRTTYSISTRINNSKTKNSQAVQAEAIRKFIASRGLQKVTIVGNSQGANKSIDLVAQLEKDGMNLGGLILTNPGGLYNQDPNELLKNFFTDPIYTSTNLLRQKASLSSLRNIGRAVRAGNDVAKGIAKEMFGSPTQFPKRMIRESEEAATLNESAKQVKARIVIVLGAKDTVFPSEKLIPDTAHDEVNEEGTHYKSVRAQKERSEAMKKIFPSSRGVKVLEATKLSNHGLHLMRSDEVAETSIYMLKRMERGQI